MDAATPAGGWPYYAGKVSRLEPTVWGLLALLPDAGRPAAAAGPLSRHRAFIASARNRDGLLVFRDDVSPNFAVNGLAALLFQRYPDLFEPDETRLLLATVTARHGESLPQSEGVTQDNSLRGWSWTDGTFSWVEPTAWCLLALKKAAARRAGAVSEDVAARVSEGEAVLIDRCIPGGGWNYGNSVAFGQDLQPYMQTTAAALLAMQDRRDHPRVQQSLRYLQAHRLAESSGMAPALTLICLRIYGLPGNDVERRLLDITDRVTAFSNLHVIAMVLYALTAADHGNEALRV